MSRHERERGGLGNLIKYSFGFVNLLIFVGGALLLGFGAAALSGDNSAFSDIVSASLYTGTAVLIIVAGSFVVIVSFFGCCGAFRESRCMLATFFCLVLLLFVLTLSAAIASFVFGGDSITTSLRDAMTKSLDNYKDGEPAAVAAWDTVQQDFQCCGVNGFQDYRDTEIPDSCFDNMDRDNPVNLHINGCFDETLRFIEENSALLGGIAMGASVFLLMAMVASCFLMRTVE
ncbi:tetraspanin-18-like [Amphibalanus amphitrite]|uniref:tetraspanin-18-like n=1 Tax=Amphibalanus amphitrite TaxID=1232801 RepID=UPI001C923CF1|nr:tetraspanin-18-like [Amphibalanus amphitrite]